MGDKEKQLLIAQVVAELQTLQGWSNVSIAKAMAIDLLISILNITGFEEVTKEYDKIDTAFVRNANTNGSAKRIADMGTFGQFDIKKEMDHFNGEIAFRDYALKEKYSTLMKDQIANRFPEDAHTDADKILGDLLRELGFGEIVDLWVKVEKWYS